MYENAIKHSNEFLKGVRGMIILTIIEMFYISFSINSQNKHNNNLNHSYYHFYYCQPNMTKKSYYYIFLLV